MEILITLVLGLTSVISVTFIIERGLVLRWDKVLPPAVVTAVASCRTSAELDMLRRVCGQQASALSRLLLAAIDHLDLPKAENVDALQTCARHEVSKLERGLVVLEIVTGIAPLLGLVGTIYGLIRLFGTLGQAGLADHAAFASGIAIALNATLAGLLVAIPSLVAWSMYSKKVETMAVEMERVCEEFLRRQYRNGKAS
jgi:biopolymer transport protein ExbB